MLATTIDLKRTVGKHRPLILDFRGVIISVESHLVGAGEIVQTFPIGREGGWKRIEREIFAAIRPDRLAGNFRQHFKTMHELDDPAGLKPLARVWEAGTAIFVPGKSAAGKLTVRVHHRV